MDQKLYDTIIIGGGPAGAAAAVYAARKKLKTLVITEDFGGQSMVSAGIQNWIGEENITGLDLSKKLEKHVRVQEGIEVKSPERVTGAKEGADCIFEITTDKGETYRSKSLIIGSGARRRRLNVPGGDKFEGRGLAFCSTCDAPFFKDQDVAVIGGGNAAIETVIDLLSYAKKIYLLIRGEDMKGDPITQEKVRKSPKVALIQNTEVQEILGDKTLTGLRYKDRKQGEIKELFVGGVFVEIGSVPNSEFISRQVINWSLGSNQIRISVPVGVSYGSDVEEVREALLEAAASVDAVLKDPAPMVRLKAFGDSAIEFEVLGWTREMLHRPREFVSRMNFAIHASLKRHGIQIPFPQRDLHLRSAVPLPFIAEGIHPAGRPRPIPSGEGEHA